MPIACRVDQLLLVGAFNECAAIDRASSHFCAISAHAVSAIFQLRGTSHEFILYLTIPTQYAGAGEYALTDGTAEVDLREYATGSYWQSVAGVLHVSTRDGRSGTVSAILEASVGNNSVGSALPLSIDGAWSCA